MNISELARAFGVRPSTLRFYERIELRSPAGRVSGRRRYDNAAEQRLALILSAQASGLTLKEIKGLISAAAAGELPTVFTKGRKGVPRAIVGLVGELSRPSRRHSVFTLPLGCAALAVFARDGGDLFDHFEIRDLAERGQAAVVHAHGVGGPHHVMEHRRRQPVPS